MKAKVHELESAPEMSNCRQNLHAEEVPARPHVVVIVEVHGLNQSQRSVRNVDESKKSAHAVGSFATMRPIEVQPKTRTVVDGTG